MKYFNQIKKTMNILKFSGIIIVSFILFFTSCNPDDDDGPDTGDIRDRISGDWKCSETNPTHGPQNYFVDIVKDTASSNKVYIYNFFNLGIHAHSVCEIDGFSITIQSIPVDGRMFQGYGTISTNYKRINWSYTFDEGNGPEEVTGSYTKL